MEFRRRERDPALGGENPALRIGRCQRAPRVKRRFYHHYLDDDDCEAIISGTIAGKSIYAPEKWDELAEDLRVLEEEFPAVLVRMSSRAIAAQRDVDALERLDKEAQARRDLGLEAEEAENQGERARVEALRKDRVALSARFARWFPQRPAGCGVRFPGSRLA